jgi:hypothetical protein
MLPSAVNDTMRDMMAQIRDCGDGIRDGTYTMTAPKITGGTITGVTFTSIVVTGGSITGTTVTSNTFSSSGSTITGGTINSTAIGGTTAAAGKFTTLEATGVATVSAGSVSAPAITTTGDTNTGIFFPAADTIAFAEGGAEAMRIDSSGNVGIGTDSPEGKLHVLSGSAGTVTAPSGFPLVLEGTTIAGMSVLTSNTGEGRIWFGDPDDNDVGRIEYAHSTNAMTFRTNATDRMVIDSSGNLQFNSGFGSVATAYGCRAWVNFNGTGTVAIRGSGNVSSITDNGTGNYTVNFTNAMPDANYAWFTSGGRTANSGNSANLTSAAPTTSALRFNTMDSSFNPVDHDFIAVGIFR